MATLTSHLLNGVYGTHAAQVDMTLTRLASDGGRELVLSAKSDNGGRLSVTVNTFANAKYEMAIACAAYFHDQNLRRTGLQIVEDIVIRFSMPDPEARYHIPVIMSPNSYSCWWSE